MIQQVFSVFDKQADCHMQPFFMPTVGMAIRAFTDTCADPNGQFKAHPGDYTLWHIASFDDQNGVFDQTEARGQVFSATDALNMEGTNANA